MDLHQRRSESHPWWSFRKHQGSTRRFCQTVLSATRSPNLSSHWSFQVAQFSDSHSSSGDAAAKGHRIAGPQTSLLPLRRVHWESCQLVRTWDRTIRYCRIKISARLSWYGAQFQQFHRPRQSLWPLWSQPRHIKTHSKKPMRLSNKISAFRYVVEHLPGERNVWVDILTPSAVTSKRSVASAKVLL